MQDSGSLTVNLVQVPKRRVVCCDLEWWDGVIVKISERGGVAKELGYLIPGFVDAHVHVESSLLPPSEFARLVMRHGTVACVADPHEIANVLGVDGVRFMLKNARCTPFHFLFGASPCVPATDCETSGARLDVADLAVLFAEADVGFLAEVMNYPGVLAGDADMAAKIALARNQGHPVDGHAPGLRGREAARYAAAGISTDHECRTLEEALDKLQVGMHVLIREGSAARNFAALQPLISSYPQRIMFCSDDKHPDDLARGHIDRLAARAVAAGHDVFDVLQAACINPVFHYRLPVGMLRVGDVMDAVEVADLSELRPCRTWLRGRLAAEEGKSLLPRVPVAPVNRFLSRRLPPSAFAVPAAGERLRVIEVTDGELVTRERLEPAPIRAGCVVPAVARDLLLLTVVNRYADQPPAVAFARGFGFKRGALASSVAHDSHNVVAVGADAESLSAAVNAVMAAQGGLAVVHDGGVELLPLPIAGLMSMEEGDAVAARYAQLNRLAQGLGSALSAPFMTLSFMALLVIPELKLSDRGLFDGRRFAFVPVTEPAP